MCYLFYSFFFFSSRRRHTRFDCDWSSDVCSSDLDWQEALRAAARRLEAAWLALEDEVAAERQRWAPEIADVAAWRPALWPVFVLWVPLAALLLWLGLVLGGYLGAPAWLAARLGF